MDRLKDWAVSVFCWDGILPFVLVAIASATKLIFPKQEVILIVVNVVVPIAAFFVRLAIGGKRFEKGEHYGWQIVLFAVAIFFLVLVDAFFIILHALAANQAKMSDWIMLGTMYVCYLLVMAVALFPLRALLKGQLIRADNDPLT